MKRIFALLTVVLLLPCFAASADTFLLDESSIVVYSFEPSAVLEADITDESEENLRKIAGALISDGCAPTAVEDNAVPTEDIAFLSTMSFERPYAACGTSPEQLQVYLTFSETNIICTAVGDGIAGLFLYDLNEGSGTGTIVLPSGDAAGDYTSFFEERIANGIIDRYYQIY